MFQENKFRQIFRKTNSSYLLIRTRTYAFQGVRNVCFFGKFSVLCFLEIPVLRFPLLTYYRQNDKISNNIFLAKFELDRDSRKFRRFFRFYKAKLEEPCWGCLMVSTPAIYLGDIFRDILVTDIISTFKEQNRTFVIKYFFSNSPGPPESFKLCNMFSDSTNNV